MKKTIKQPWNYNFHICYYKHVHFIIIWSFLNWFGHSEFHVMLLNHILSLKNILWRQLVCPLHQLIFLCVLSKHIATHPSYPQVIRMLLNASSFTGRYCIWDTVKETSFLCGLILLGQVWPSHKKYKFYCQWFAIKRLFLTIKTKSVFETEHFNFGLFRDWAGR